MRSSLFYLLLFTLAALPARAEQRIVSLGGSVTEIVFELGMGDRLVAVDSTSLYPAEADALPDVGYLRQLSAEPIVSLAPDLVLASSDAGPANVLLQLQDAKVPVAIVADLASTQGVRQKIQTVAKALGVPAKGEELSARVLGELARLTSALQERPQRPDVLFVMAASSGAALVAGEDTAAQAMIELAGGANAFVGATGYKPLSPEMAALINPRLVIVAAHGLSSLGGLEALAARADLGLLPAVKEGRVLIVDANRFLGFGPRVAAAAWELALLLHPDLTAPAP